jgi:nitroreductase
VEICPNKILGIDQEKRVYFLPEKESICMECGQCMAVCASAAITVDDLSYEKDFFDLPENKVGYKLFMDFIANRRSIRNFKKTAVSDELVNQILESVSFAPFGAAPEKMHITVVNNREIIESALPLIEQFLTNIIKWIENPIAAFMMKSGGNRESFHTVKNFLYPIIKKGNYQLKSGDHITRDAPLLFLIHAETGAEEHTSNAMIYATYMMLAAASLGLGTLMNGIVPPAVNHVADLRHLFRIPDDHDTVISLLVGYPKYKYHSAILRKKHTLHFIS